MNKLFRQSVLALALITGFSASALADDADTAPSPSQDPVLQSLQLNSTQVTKIQQLQQQFATNVSNIYTDGYEQGALVEVIESGKWDDAKVKQQLDAVSQLNEKVHYYRVKYYFDVNQVLTPEQRKQIKEILPQALN